MTHVHKWLLEPCLQTHPSINPDEIDGELYTERNTRGNILAACECGRERKFHPFSRRPFETGIGLVPLERRHEEADLAHAPGVLV